MQYLGDYAEDSATLNFKFSTHKADGTPATLSGTPAISAYKANGTTQSTAGITLSVDFDSVTGLNNVLIDLSADAFYAVANDYQAVITTGTVDGVSVVGTVLAHFSIENRFNEVNVTLIEGSDATNQITASVPSAATIRAEIDSNSTKLSDIVADTNEIQGELADGGRTDLLIDAIKLKTDDISTAAAIVDAMLDELLTGHSTPGSVGISITDTLGYVTALRSALTDLRAAALDRIVGTIATGTHNPQSGDTYAIVNNGTYGNAALETLVDDIETLLGNGTYGLNALLTAIGTRLATTGYTVPPTVTQIRQEMDSNSTQLATILADTAEIQSELADGGRTDLLIDGIKTVTDHLGTAMELDGAVYRFTENALEEAPGGGSGGDATAANQTIIINHLTDVKGATFSGSTDSLEAIRNRGDVAWITGGTGGGSNAVTINVKASTVNVVDCYVEIWDSAGTSFISRTNTNSSGNVTFGLDTNTYIVKMHKTGYYFENQKMEVGHDETFPYTGTILTPDAATDPTLCRIYGYYFDPAGAAYSAIKSLIKLTAIYEASDNNYYTSELVGTYNTTTGLLYFDVIQGASVTLEIPILNIKKSFVVPAETLYKISDIA